MVTEFVSGREVAGKTTAIASAPTSFQDYDLTNLIPNSPEVV
jgi:hypothetical protein